MLVSIILNFIFLFINTYVSVGFIESSLFILMSFISSFSVYYSIFLCIFSSLYFSCPSMHNCMCGWEFSFSTCSMVCGFFGFLSLNMLCYFFLFSCMPCSENFLFYGSFSCRILYNTEYLAVHMLFSLLVHLIVSMRLLFILFYQFLGCLSTQFLW